MNKKIIYDDLNEIYSNGLDYSMFSGKTVLITGAYGMITSYLTLFFMYLNSFKNVNISIIVLTKSKKKFYDRFNQFYDNKIIELYETDLNHEITINRKVDYIIHAASIAKPDLYSIYPIEVIEPNVLGTIKLLEYAKNNLDINGKFIFFSAGNIYGSVKDTEYIDEDTFAGLDPLHIYNCYTESKRMGETLCKAYSVEYGIKFNILRIWHTFSPFLDLDNDTRAFASFIKNLRDNEDIIINSDGKSFRSFCYITDAVSMMLYIILKGDINNPYNVCNSNQFISIRALAELITNLRKDKNLKVIVKNCSDNDKHVENVVLKNVLAVPSNKKVKELGFTPTVSIKNGFDRVLKYMGI